MPPSRIDLSAATFQRDLKGALKRHPSVKQDLQGIFELLETDSERGAWIPGLNQEVRKIRVGVKAQGIGKSKGYRLIYLVDKARNVLTPLLFHFKPDVEMVSNKEIAGVLENLQGNAERESDVSGQVN